MKTRRGLAALALTLVLGTAPGALAQQPPKDPPKGPAEIISGARKARDAREMSRAVERSAPAKSDAPEQATEGSTTSAAQPSPAQAPAARTAAEDPHGTATRKPIAEERPAPSLPAGSLRVHVLDESDRPLPGAAISLGIMAASGDRSSKDAKTGPDGSYTFTGLAAGEQQAYRVNVPHQGAKYSSSPFRLPHVGGYEVTIRRLEVTRDARMLVLYVGATSVELQDDRLKVVQQSRLLNLGSKTYVFPAEGLLLELPASVLSTQSQESMGDQRVVEELVEGERKGLRIHGSVPPGEVTLLWGFDLPLEGTSAVIDVALPWPTFAYRVIADAPKGLTLDVRDMPEPMHHDDAGRRFLITEMQRRVGETPFKRLVITLDGIPGQGPSRFIALGLALAIIAAGLVLASKSSAAPSSQAPARDFRKEQRALIARARALDKELAAGEIGPEHHREQRAAIEDELSLLLLEEHESLPSQERAVA